MFCDGAFGQIATLLNTQLGRIKDRGLKIRLGKYAGGCSMSQSANDQGKMHAILKQQFQSPSFKYEEQKKDREGNQWKQLETMMNPLDSSSKQTFWKCLQQAPEFLSKAFQPLTILSAYKKSGVSPYVPEIVLSHNPKFFKQLSTPDAKKAITSIDALANAVDEYGMVREIDFDIILESSLDDSQPKTGKPLNDMAANRQRSLLLDTFEENRKRVREETPEDNPAPKAKKRAIRCVCGKEMKEHDVFVGGNSNDGSFEVWSKCPGARCLTKFCSSIACQQMLQIHMQQCVKIAQQPAPKSKRGSNSTAIQARS